MITDRIPITGRQLGRASILATQDDSHIAAGEPAGYGLDRIGLAQLILFNYPLGGRTLFNGVSFREVLPGHLKLLCQLGDIDLTRTSSHGIADIEETFLTAIQRTGESSTRPCVMLSGGYDSRVLLAALVESGHEPVTMTFHNRSTPGEMHIARELAEMMGLEWRSVADREISACDYREYASKYLESSLFISSPVRLMYYAQASEMIQDADRLFSGEGEILRPPGHPSEYISAAAHSLICTGKSATPESGFEFRGIFTDLPWAEAMSEARETVPDHVRKDSRVLSWILRTAYPLIYGSMAMAFGSLARVELPFLDSEFVRTVAQSEYRFQHYAASRAALSGLIRSRRAYHRMLSDFAPVLLDIVTDRGYEPASDSSAFNTVFSVLRAYPSHRRRVARPYRASRSARSYIQFIREELESRPESIPFVDAGKLSRMLDRSDHWSGNDVRELSKALQVKYLFDSGLICR